MRNSLKQTIVNVLTKEAGINFNAVPSGVFVSPSDESQMGFDQFMNGDDSRIPVESALSEFSRHGVSGVSHRDGRIYARDGLDNKYDTHSRNIGTTALISALASLGGLAWRPNRVSAGIAAGGAVGAIALGALAANRANKADKNRQYGDEQDYTERLTRGGYSDAGVR